jgi:MFS family permease
MMLLSYTSASARSILTLARTSLRSLKHRRLRWYFAGVAVSLLGTFLQLTLLRWAAYDFTGSTATLGMLSLCSLIPNAVLAVPAGLFVAGQNKRNVLLVTQIAAAVPAACFAALAEMHALSASWLLSLSLVLGCIMPFETAARFPLMAECVEGEHPFNAFSLSALVFYLSRCAGPLLGSAVLGLFSVSTGFLINFASYIVEVLTLLRMGAGSQPVPANRPNFREVRRFCMRIDNAYLLAGVALVSFLGVQLQLMPALADKLYSTGSSGFGLLLAANELGAVGAALWLTTRDDSFDQSCVLKSAMLAMSGGLMLFCFGHWLLLGLVSMFIVGLAQGLLITASQNVLQGRADQRLKAPLSSIFWAGFFCFQGIGASVLSMFAEAWDLRSVFVVVALTLLAVAFIGRRQ